MQKKVIFVVVFCMLLVTTLYTFGSGPAFNITGTIYRVGFHERFARIQDAIDDSAVSDGDIIEVRYNATPYYENITVYKSVIIRVDEIDRMKGDLPVVDGGNKKGIVFYVNATNVEIDGFIVRNGLYGIWLAQNCCSIRNNQVNLNGFEGIYVGSTSADNFVYNNTVTSNGYGISLNGPNNTLIENTMSSNQYNLDLENSIQNIDPSNTVNGKPVYFLINQTDMQVPSGAGFVAIENSARITVENLTLQENSPDLLVENSSAILVKNLTIQGGEGIVFNNVSDSIVENVVLSNVSTGVFLDQSQNNVVSRITFDNSAHQGPGTGSAGVWLEKSNNNLIADNQLIMSQPGQQQGDGIVDSGSVDNVIVANNISYANYAFEIWSSNGSVVYHNNIFDSASRAHTLGSHDVHFDNGYEGNYWSDYKQENPNATEIEKFGIWNTYYPASPNFNDNYPLVNPWSACRTLDQPMQDRAKYQGLQKLFTYSNSTIGSLDFNRSYNEIVLRATSGYSGFLNLTIPRNWTDNPYSVTVDGVTCEHLCTLNASFSCIYLEFAAGMHLIRIIGSELGSFQGDVNHDGKVNILDIVAVAVNFGASEKGP